MFQRDPMQADMLGHTGADCAEQAGTHAPQHSAHAGDMPGGMQLHTNHPKMCPKGTCIGRRHRQTHKADYNFRHCQQQEVLTSV